MKSFIMKGRIELSAFWQWGLALVLVLALAGVSHQAFAAGGTWTTKTQMPYECYGAAAGVIGNKLYVAGGKRYTPDKQSEIINDSLLVYDPVTDSWDTSKAPMSFGGQYAAAAGVIGNKLYVVGGGDSTGDTKKVQAYDQSTNTWSKKADMPSDSFYVTAGVINNKLYLVCDGNQLTLYDPETDTWTLPTAERLTRYNAAAGIINGILYLVGGNPLLKIVEAYDPANPTWEIKADMPTPRWNLGVGVINGRLYAVGGYGTVDGISLTTVEAYDPGSGTPGSDLWTTETSMPTPRGDAAVGVINGKLYVAGGLNYYNDGYSVDIVPTLEAFTPSGTEAITVTIDIKPGENPNSINLGSNGKVPVAILSAANFDATQVDPLSVTLAGAHVALKGKGSTMASWQDVNGDGRLDLVVQVDTQSFQLSDNDTEAVLEGNTYADGIYYGKAILGTDTVRIVP